MLLAFDVFIFPKDEVPLVIVFHCIH